MQGMCFSSNKVNLIIKIKINSLQFNNISILKYKLQTNLPFFPLFFNFESLNLYVPMIISEFRIYIYIYIYILLWMKCLFILTYEYKSFLNYLL